MFSVHVYIKWGSLVVFFISLYVHSITCDLLISVLPCMASLDAAALHGHCAVTPPPYIFWPIDSLVLLLHLSVLFCALSFSLPLSFVYLLKCEIILGWRDGFLPEGLSGGVSLLFNNRLGVYVYLSTVIDIGQVLDNKPNSGGWIYDTGCALHSPGIIWGFVNFLRSIRLYAIEDAKQT